MSSPLRILAVDVGTGTQDILLFESGKTIENCFKMVMPSPTVIVAERIKRATERGRPLLLTGVTMGGGPCHWAARDHALAGFAVAVTAEAGRTFDDDLAMVEQMGFEIIEDAEAARRVENPALLHIELQDFDAQAIVTALRAFDVDPGVDKNGAARTGAKCLRLPGSGDTRQSDTPPGYRRKHSTLSAIERLRLASSPTVDGYRFSRSPGRVGGPACTRPGR